MVRIFSELLELAAAGADFGNEAEVGPRKSSYGGSATLAVMALAMPRNE